MSAFSFIDEVTELNKNQSVTAIYRLKADAEFLKDHFENFPVMPGVLLLETLKQTAGRLLELSGIACGSCWRLAEAQDVKFGQFVRPGSVLKSTARLVRQEEGKYYFDGRIDLIGQGQEERGKALSAGLTLTAIEKRSHPL